MHQMIAYHGHLLLHFSVYNYPSFGFLERYLSGDQIRSSGRICSRIFQDYIDDYRRLESKMPLQPSKECLRQSSDNSCHTWQV